MITVHSPTYCPYCPVCGAQVSVFATVKGNKPGHPPSDFWGNQGDRVLAHSVAGAWCHIRVGGEHRLAYLIEAANDYMRT